MRIYAAALALVAILAFASPEGSECTVQVNFTLHSSTGPIVIEDACLVSQTYDGAMLVIDARDIGDSIFRNGFELEDMR